MNTLRPLDRAFVAYARWVERATLHLIGPQRLLRAIFRATAPLGARKPKGTGITRDAQGALWITPPGVAPDAPVLMYLHGGGFTIGAPETHAAMAAHLGQAAGLRVVLPRYRLAPEHPFPAARDDARTAWAALPEPPVALGGDSAGGCLALQLACHLRDTGQPVPRALVLLAPIADLSGDLAARFARAPAEILIPPAWPRRLIRDYLPGMDRADPAISPLFGDLKGLPPTLIQAAEGEVLAEDSARVAEAMDDARLSLWPGLPHVWQLHAGIAPAADAAIAELGAFLRAAR